MVIFSICSLLFSLVVRYTHTKTLYSVCSLITDHLVQIKVRFSGFLYDQKVLNMSFLVIIQNCFSSYNYYSNIVPILLSLYPFVY